MNGPFSADFVALGQRGHAGVMKMTARFTILIVALTALGFATLPLPMAHAQNSLRTYFNPQVYGKPVALCMTGKASCGKPTADAWCRDHGFSEALVYERLKTADKSLVFRQIKCITREEAVAASDSTVAKATP